MGAKAEAMKRLPCRLGLALLLTMLVRPGVAAQETPADNEERPSFPGEVELVTVDVVVTDEDGNPVTGLTADDFTVLEEDEPQAISSFEAVELPPAPSKAPPPRPPVSTNMVPERRTGRSFLILFDDLHLTPQDAPQAKGAVATFLREGVREGDKVGLLATSGDAWWSTRMEAGREDLLAIVRRLEGRRLPESRLDRLSDWEAMRIAQNNDTIVGQTVLRRFQTLRLMPDNAFPAERVERVRQDREENDLLYGRGINDLMIESRASETYNYVRIRARRTLAALERALESLMLAKGRKSLILVSDGFVFDTSLDGFKDVVRAARRSNVALYFLNTRGLEGLEGLYGADRVQPMAGRDTGAVLADVTQESAGSEHLASATGGFTIRNTNDLDSGIQRIARESLSYYLLGYTPNNPPRDGSYRRIEVKVRGGEDLNIRARKGYYAPREGEDPDERTKVDADIQRALDSPYFNDQIPLRMTSFVREETLFGHARTLLTIEIDVTDLTFQERKADGYQVGVLNFLLGVAERDSSDVRREDKEVEIVLRPGALGEPGPMWYTVTREFELTPGRYQAKVVVRDPANHKLGAVAHEFEVPELTGLRVSTPILSDRLQQTSESAAGAMALARRQFASGRPLFCQFDVYGAASGEITGMPRVTAGYALVRSDGTTVALGEPTAIEPTSLGFVSRLWGLPLQGVEPGDYDLVITVRDEVAGEVRTLREPFTVTAPPGPVTTGG
jgi:VWFA-related protein